MAEPTLATGGGLAGTLRGDLANPLFRNAYALIANGGLTGLLGLAYWGLAGRLYDPADVGRNWAVIQAVMFVGGLTALNFMLIRFVPQTARGTARFVTVSYVAGGGLALLIALGFVLSLGWWDGGASFSQLHSPGPALWFLVMALGWNIFTQQDAVFTGLRRAHWVPVENTVFSVVKLALLVALVVALPHDGVIVSWMLPVVVTLVPVNLLIFARLIPAHAAETDGRQPPPSRREVLRFMSGDYVGGIFLHCSINLIPVVVALQVDSGTNAYFQMAWVLAMMMNIFAVSMSMSLTVEGAFDRTTLAAATRGTLRRIALLMTPVTVLVIATAPYALEFIGHDYASRGASLLRILALATLPTAFIELYLGVLRVQSRTGLIALIQAARLFGVLALMVVLPFDSVLTRTGVAVLVVHLVIVAATFPALRRAAAPSAEAPPGGMQ